MKKKRPVITEQELATLTNAAVANEKTGPLALFGTEFEKLPLKQKKAIIEFALLENRILRKKLGMPIPNDRLNFKNFQHSFKSNKQQRESLPLISKIKNIFHQRKTSHGTNPSPPG